MSLNIFQLLDLKKGLSLPLWVAAAAKSAVKKLLGLPFENYELIKIPNKNELIKVEVHSAALINGNLNALGISFAQSGLSLDLTQNLEIWTLAALHKISGNNQKDRINFIAGYGVGIREGTSEICMSGFAKSVIYKNLVDIIPEGLFLNLEIIFPKGKFLAERTSNKSFGIVEGLSIIGTSAETYSSASPDQLKNAKSQIEAIIKNDFDGTIVFVIGENGLNLAKSCNIQFPIVKVGNWIGPLLVHAAIKNIKNVILFGYHGKLIKLAGGIFHTHNHLADARKEILVSLAVDERIPMEMIIQLSKSNNIEDALLLLEGFNKSKADKLLNKLAITIEKRSFDYVNRYTKTEMQIAAVIFDRKRKIKCLGVNGKKYISDFQCN